MCPAPVKVTINELRNDTFGNGYSILAVTKQRCTVPLAIPVGGLAGFSAWILHKTAGSAEEDVVTEESLAQRWSIDVRAVRPGTAVDRLKCRWRQTCPMIIGPPLAEANTGWRGNPPSASVGLGPRGGSNDCKRNLNTSHTIVCRYLYSNGIQIAHRAHISANAVGIGEHALW